MGNIIISMPRLVHYILTNELEYTNGGILKTPYDSDEVDVSEDLWAKGELLEELLSNTPIVLTEDNCNLELELDLLEKDYSDLEDYSIVQFGNINLAVYKNIYCDKRYRPIIHKYNSITEDTIVAFHQQKSYDDSYYVECLGFHTISAYIDHDRIYEPIGSDIEWTDLAGNSCGLTDEMIETGIGVIEYEALYDKYYTKPMYDIDKEDSVSMLDDDPDIAIILTWLLLNRSWSPYSI